MNDPDRYSSCNNPEFQYLICIICDGVFLDPVQCPNGHIFCRKCICRWLKKSKTCPMDRGDLQTSLLTNAPPLIKRILSSLHLRCQYYSLGCRESFPDESTLKEHLKSCMFKLVMIADHNYSITKVAKVDKDDDHSSIWEGSSVVSIGQFVSDGRCAILPNTFYIQVEMAQSSSKEEKD